MDRLQAITVCVNYADLLECIAPNKSQFDRWVIVTHRKDKKTIDVCKRHGLEYIFSRRLYQGGATFHKAKALNDGLDYLDNSGWVAVLDADVFLPGDFRQRLDAQELHWRTLYGIKGRKVCLDYEEFCILKNKEPWNILWYSTSILGYFNLFNFSQPRNRYPEEHSKDASAYDMMFSDSFPERFRKKLPIPCLHLGPVKENWKGRRSRKFRARTEVGFRGGLSGGLEELMGMALPKGRQGGKVVMIGYYSGREAAIFSSLFDEVLIIDEWGLHKLHWDPLENADREILADRFDRQTRECGNLHRLGEHTAETLSKVDDRSLQGVFFGGELDAQSLTIVVPAWTAKLARDGFISGSGFGWPHFAENSQAISLAVGTPDFVVADGSWLKWNSGRRPGGAGGFKSPWRGRKSFFPLPLPLRCIDPLGLDSAISPRRGVLYFVDGLSEFEDLIVSIHSLRAYWDGPVCVVYRGDEEPALQITLNRYGVQLLQMMASDSDGSRAEMCLKALPRSPFRETLFLENETLVLGPVDPLFQLLQERDCVFTVFPEEFKAIRLADLMRLSNPLPAEESALAVSFIYHPVVGLSCFLFKSHGAVSNRDLHENAVRLARSAYNAGCAQVRETVLQSLLPSIRYRTAPDEWMAFEQSAERKITPETRIFSHVGVRVPREDSEIGILIGSIEEKILEAHAGLLRKPIDLPVVTVVVPENFEDFRRNMSAWKFDSGGEIVAVFAGIDAEIWKSYRWPGRVRIVPVQADQDRDSVFNAGRALLKAIPEAVETDHFIYLNAGCSPKPGAELFLSEKWRSHGLVGCGWTNVRAPRLNPRSARETLRDEASFRHLSILNGIGLIRVELLRESARFLAMEPSSVSFEELLSVAAALSHEKQGVISASNWGWEGC